MCLFITLIAPTDDVSAVRAVMDRHDREAARFDNPSIRKVLLPGEQQYLTTRGHCDCGTVLTQRNDTPGEVEAARAKEIARMRRKGWSDAKIARAMEDHNRAEARPRGSEIDSLDLWNDALHDLGSSLKLPYVGLLVRQYSGALDTETFSALRKQLPKSTAWIDALGSLEEDEVTIFSL